MKILKILKKEGYTSASLSGRIIALSIFQESELRAKGKEVIEGVPAKILPIISNPTTIEETHAIVALGFSPFHPIIESDIAGLTVVLDEDPINVLVDLAFVEHSDQINVVLLDVKIKE